MDLDKVAEGILEKQKEAGIPEVHVGNVNGLFLDASSTCTGYTIVNFDISNKRKPATLTKAGVLWFGSDWEHGDIYSYIYNSIVTYFDIVEKIDLIVYEQYSVNPDKGSGILVLPELIGCVKLAGKEAGIPVLNILPQTWRSQIQLKPDIKVTKEGKNKRDYKTPCINYMKSLVKNYPDQSVSNITKKTRATPSDLADSMGVALGWLKKNGFNTISYNHCTFNGHVQILD